MTSGLGRASRPRALRGSVAALALLALLVRPGPAQVEAADAEAHSEHVAAKGDVEAEALERYVALAEAVYPQWKAYFRAEPKKPEMPLRLDVRRDRESFLAALRRAGVGPSAVASAGGYYDPGSKVSFLYLQPHDSSTRLLVLHELTHQYQSKAVLDGDLTRSPLWHKEGLAEHFGFHRRTAAGVAIGALDVVTIDDRPLQCAERVKKGTFDPWAVGTGAAAPVDYTDALALVETLLRTKDKGLLEALRRFEADLDHGGDPGKKFESEFAGKRERLAAAAREVWGGFRRTWKIVYIAWDEEPGAIVAKGMPWAFLLGGADVPRDKTSIEARVNLVGLDAAAGGIALGCKGPDDMIAADLRADGRVLLRHKVQGRWFELGAAASPAGPPHGPVKLRLEAQGASLRVELDDVPLLTVNGTAAGLSPADVEGPAGLLAEGGPVRFTDVKTGG